MYLFIVCVAVIYKTAIEAVPAPLPPLCTRLISSQVLLLTDLVEII